MPIVNSRFLIITKNKKIIILNHKNANLRSKSICKFENSKFNRYFKVVEGDLERVFERAEEHETKGQEIESQVRELEAKVRFSKNNLFF